ncbi:MAG: alpha/beta hydrolase [Pseudomonadota bacterium]
MTNDLDYSNAQFIPDADSFVERWEHDAAEYREIEQAVGRAWLNKSYGPDPRHAFDLFLPSGRPQGVLIFVHGGYWLKFDNKSWSHFAAGAQQAGWAVAMPSYRLVPSVRIAEITLDVRDAIVAISRDVPGPICLAGHSAGGHLVARMMNADVALPDNVAARIAHVTSISPVSDLTPLIDTAMNVDFGLDVQLAGAESPAKMPKARPVNAAVWVGAEERPAFLDQARWLAEAWGVPLHVAPGRHHFDILDLLCDPTAGLLGTCLGGQP